MHAWIQYDYPFIQKGSSLNDKKCMKEWFSLTLPKYTAVTNIKSNSGKETNQYKTKKP